MSSQNGVTRADGDTADVEVMLGPPRLYTNLNIVDRSLEEMVSRVAAWGCTPTRQVSTNSGPTCQQGPAGTHKCTDSELRLSTQRLKTTRASEQ